MKDRFDKRLNFVLSLTALAACGVGCSDDAGGSTTVCHPECGEMQTCVDSVCVDDVRICGEIICKEGSVCQDGECVLTDPCQDKHCGEGMECSAGECVPVDLCKTINCLPGQQCLSGQCLDEACIVDGAEKTCDAGKMCVAGECVDDGCIVNGAPMVCDEGWTCIKGTCEEIACLDKVCNEGRTCVAGECVDNACLEMTCEVGSVCVKGECVLEACVDVVCPQTKVCQADGSCAFVAPPALKVTFGDDLSAGENGDSVSFQVVLSEQPASDVHVACESEDETEGLAECGIVFTAENWNMPQTLTAIGVDDNEIDGDVSWKLMLSTQSEDVAFNGLAAEGQFVTLDNDTANVMVTVPEGMMTGEDGTSSAFELVLSAQPKSEVALMFATSDATEGVTDVTSAVFTPENWNVPQTITVTGVDDDIEEPGGMAYTIVFEKTQSEDAHFHELEIPVISLINQDNDVAGMTITGAADGLTTDELGASHTLGVVLNTQPEAAVMLTVTVSDIGEANSDIQNLTIEPEAWKTVHPIVISGVADHILDGDQTYTVTISVDSEDPHYKLESAIFNGINIDTDKAGFSIESSGTTTVTEAGSTATFAVSLLSQPSADVEVSLSSLDTTELEIVTTALTFKPDNWNVPQTVTVRGVNDDDDDGDIETKVRIQSVSSDIQFNELVNENMVLRTIDDDTAGLVVTGTSAILPENGGSAPLSIQLQAKPAHPVQIKLTSSDITELQPSVSALNFDSTNWNVPQDILLNAVDDTHTDGNQTAYVTLVTTSDDDLFHNLSVPSPIYTIQDNESAGISLSPSTTVLSPENPTAILSVSLSAQPTHNVTVTLATSDDNIAHLSTTTVTFTPENWNTPQEVTISSPNQTVAVSDAVITSTSSSDCAAYDKQSGKEIYLKVYGFQEEEFVPPETCEEQPTYLLPGRYLLEVWGASGGDGVGNNQNVASHGGLGGYSRGELTLTERTAIYINIGKKGTGGQANLSGANAVGGGCGGGGGGGIANSNGSIGYGGGGGTDIRIGSNTVYHRVIVAGGGGGADNAGGTLNGSDDGSGGYGGGTVGGNGRTDGTLSSKLAGATQTSGYAFGEGEACGHLYDLGGGGGGWYGGKSSPTTGNHGGGGGSGFVYTEATQEYCPPEYALTEKYYLSNAQTIAGNAFFTSPSGSSVMGHAGDGYARIKLIESN